VVAIQQQLGAKVRAAATPGNSFQPSPGKIKASKAFFFAFCLLIEKIPTVFFY
jgi:hypothetical protein